MLKIQNLENIIGQTFGDWVVTSAYEKPTHFRFQTSYLNELRTVNIIVWKDDEDGVSKLFNRGELSNNSHDGVGYRIDLIEEGNPEIVEGIILRSQIQNKKDFGEALLEFIKGL